MIETFPSHSELILTRAVWDFIALHQIDGVAALKEDSTVTMIPVEKDWDAWVDERRQKNDLKMLSKEQINMITNVKSFSYQSV